VMYSAMAHAKPLADFLRDVALLRVPTVVVLAEEDYRANEDAVKRVGAEVVRLGGEAEALVRGILRGVPGAVAEAVLERYKGEFYAVAAALAKALYEEWRDPARVAEAVKRLDVYSLAVAYLWHVVLGGDEATAEWVAPLILATGFYGPHPPKLAKAVVKAFGGVPVSRVIKWFSQPLHGALYEAIEKVAHGAVYRRFGVGGDELCQGDGEGPCRLVEICAEALAGIPRRSYSGVEEVAEEYARLVAKRLNAPGPAGVRQIDFLIDDFLQAFDGVAEDGRWKIRYVAAGLEGVKTVEDFVDEQDILSAIYGLAVLPIWYSELKPLEGWFFIGGRKVGVVNRYLYPILRERSRELVKRAEVIVREVEKRGYNDVDLWRAVGIAAAGQRDDATDEELENVMKLAATALHRFATASPIILGHIESLLIEAWRRIMKSGAHGDGEGRRRLADWLTVIVYNAAIGHPPSLPHIFAVGVDWPDWATLARRIEALYNAASNVGKVQLLDTLLYAVGRGICCGIVADSCACEVALKEVDMRIKGFVFGLHSVERAYAVARLYPRLAKRYASIGRAGRATKFVEKSLRALEELWDAYEKDKASLEEALRPYLEVKLIKPDLEMELNELRRYVYSQVAHTYMVAGKLDDALRYAEMACKFARELGDVYDEVSSCWLLPRLKAVRDGVPPVKEFEEVWQRASQIAGLLGAEAIAATFGNYVVALISEGRYGEVEKVLEEWGWALELDPRISALTYGVLSLFDDRYLDKALKGLPSEAELPRLADAILSAESYRLRTSHGTIIEELMHSPGGLFLPAFVGLAYCRRGEKWGLKLARTAAWAGLRRSLGFIRRLFGELAEALKRAAVGNCVTDEVLKAVYKLYYFLV